MESRRITRALELEHFRELEHGPGPGARILAPLIRVFSVYRSRLVQQVVSGSLDRRPGLRLEGWAPRIEEAAAAIRDGDIDLVMLDIGTDLPRACREIQLLRQEFPELPILAFGVANEEDAVTLIASGASGYLLRGASLEELVSTLEAVHHRVPPCSPEVATLLFRRLSTLAQERRPTVPANLTPLTRREIQVLQLMAGGLRNKEIARQLGVTVSTVKNHVHKILEKLHADRRRTAIRRAFELGLLEGPSPWRSAVAEPWPRPLGHDDDDESDK